MKFTVEQNEIVFGKSLSISFQRTLRIPDDERTYPLPPGFGKFPLHRAEDYDAPPGWKTESGLFIPMYQREALWIGFRGDRRKPHAVKVGVGKINALSGEPWDNALHDNPQDYLVCPDQPWLDGINAGDGYIRQFVALPLGQGYTVEAQLSGKEEFGGIQILVFKPKRTKLAAAALARAFAAAESDMLSGLESVSMGTMGIGAGGKMKQKIYPDPYGSDVWEQKRYASIFVHLVNSEHYEKLTGLAPPPTPVSPQTYTESGLPWFDLYDEERGHLPAPRKLRKVKSVKRIEGRKRLATQDDEPLKTDKMQIRKLHPKTHRKDNR